MNENYQLDKSSLTKMAHQVAAVLNNDTTPSQIIRAVKKYNIAMSSMFYTISNTFAAVSATAALYQNVDAAWGFFCTNFTVQTTSTDTDQFITGIQVSSQTSIITGNLPLAVITRLTGELFPLQQYFPANSQIILSLQNGATTAVTTVRTTFVGVRVPVSVIESYIQKDKNLANG